MAKYHTRVKPLILCRKGQIFEGICPCQELDRLSSLLADKESEISYLIDFKKDNNEYAAKAQVLVVVSGAIWLRCQRCYEKMSFNLQHESVLWPVTEDRVLALPKDREPLLMDTDCSVILKDIIEEEVLLAIPTVPRHSDEECHEAGTDDVK